MATRAKEGQPGKERGLTSPSTLNERKTSKQPSIITKPTDSSTSGRNVARPATGASSSNKQPPVKKVASIDNLNRRQPNTLARRNSLDKQPITSARRNSLDKQPGTLARRNSLDRPLPASSPKTRVSPAPKERTLRSSSTFTPRTTKPPSSDRLPKLPGGAKDHHPRTISTVRKSSTFNERKQQDRTATSSKGAQRRAATPPTSEAVSIPLTAGIPLPETDEDLCASMTEADESMLNAGSSNEFADELDIAVNAPPEVEGKESDEVVHEPKIVESSIDPEPLQQDETVSDDSHLEEPADKLQEQEQETTAANDSQSEEHIETEKDNNSHLKEVDQEEPAVDNPEVEIMEDDQASEASNDNHQKSEEEREVSDNVQNETVDSLGKELADDVTEEHVVKQDNAEKAEAAETSTKPEVVQGKRDAAAVSNDVIEETASRLREQRKNRVRALASAFESVISLQDK